MSVTDCDSNAHDLALVDLGIKMISRIVLIADQTPSRKADAPLPANHHYGVKTL